MHLLFVDESGTPPKPGQDSPRYFVVGGVIIPESIWHKIRDAMMGLKVRHKIRGEIKWRYFSPSNFDQKNPLRNKTQDERNVIRLDVLKIITSESSIKCIACVCSAKAAYNLQTINSQDDLYHGTYKPVTERFQYHLQDLTKSIGIKQLGIVVSDHRGRQDDKRLRGHHQKLLHSTGEFISRYENLVEGLFLQPSNLSVGIQLADMFSGCVWRKYERGDSTWFDQVRQSIRENRRGEIDGHGVVMYPKKNWI